MDFTTRNRRRSDALKELETVQSTLESASLKVKGVEGLEAIAETIADLRHRVRQAQAQQNRTELKRTPSDWLGIEIPRTYRDLHIAHAVVQEEKATEIHVYSDSPDDGDEAIGIAYSIDPSLNIAEQLLEIGKQAECDFGFANDEHPIRFEAQP